MSARTEDDLRAVVAAAAAATVGAAALVWLAWRPVEGAQGAPAAVASLASPVARGVSSEAAPSPEPRSAARRRHFDTCRPPDPIGLGPYRPWVELPLGALAIPQRGGHDDDLGHDLLVHFHGYDAARRVVVATARGVAFLGVDLGGASGAYTRAFQDPDRFRELVTAVESALRERHGDARAHVRRIALSAWSAGYGAVVEVLRRDAPRVDAVVLLDAPHGSWERARLASPSAGDVTLRNLEPLVAFARRAATSGASLTVTHSQIRPDAYPSTAVTLDRLARELGAVFRPLTRGDDPYGPTREATLGGFAAWGFAGSDQGAHCAHLAHLERALALVESRWGTPPLDRAVPPTPSPPRPPGHDARRSSGLQLELVE